MVWAISILCVSLSCEPMPQMAGWFYTEPDCLVAVRLVMDSWNPDVGLYSLKCVSRSQI